MKSILACFIAMAAALPAWASYDVTCFAGGCLKSGWEFIDRNNLTRGEVYCAVEGCDAAGWQAVDRGRVQSETQCFDNDCFKVGWRTLDPYGRIMSRTLCMAESKDADTDCMTQGWVTDDYVNGRRVTTTCTANDCRKMGWEVEVPGYGLQIVRCKAGGCFEEGWNLRP